MSDKLIKWVRERFPKRVIGSHNEAGMATILIGRDGIVEVMEALRNDGETDMQMLIDITAVDFLEYSQQVRAATSPCDPDNGYGLSGAKMPRFEVVYHLLSLSKRHRLRVKVPLEESDLTMPTMCGVWRAANWAEREVWDMYGVVFEEHPDLRRILMYEEFQGHPLRKDYHQRGYQPLISMPDLAHYKDHSTYR